MEFKDYLRTVRKRHRLTQSQLAGMLDCSQSTVSAWENGAYVPNMEQVRGLYRCLSISLDDLYKGKKGCPAKRRSKSGTNPLISLERLRKGRKMSRAQLAELLGVSEKTIANWEARGIPHLAEIRGLVQLFGVGIDELC